MEVQVTFKLEETQPFREELLPPFMITSPSAVHTHQADKWTDYGRVDGRTMDGWMDGLWTGAWTDYGRVVGRTMDGLMDRLWTGGWTDCGRTMDGWMDGWLDGWMDRLWTGGWTDCGRTMDGWLDGLWTDYGRVVGRVDGWTDGRMNEWMNGWIDGGVRLLHGWINGCLDGGWIEFQSSDKSATIEHTRHSRKTCLRKTWCVCCLKRNSKPSDPERGVLREKHSPASHFLSISNFCS